MARPRKDTPPELFTSTEVAVAVGLSPRNFSLLTDRGYAPAAEEETSGKSGNRLFGQRAFARCALIAALQRAGIDLLLAARLTEALAGEIEPNHQTLPSRLFDIWYKLPKEERSTLPASRVETEYWLHQAVVNSEIYGSGKAIRGDLIIDIVNGRYVLTRTTLGLKIHSPVTNEGIDAQPLCIIKQMERGGALDIESFEYQVGEFEHENQDDKKRWRIIEDDYLENWREFESKLSVNISLSIRNAYDSLKRYRETKN